MSGVQTNGHGYLGEQRAQAQGKVRAWAQRAKMRAKTCRTTNVLTKRRRQADCCRQRQGRGGRHDPPGSEIGARGLPHTSEGGTWDLRFINFTKLHRKSAKLLAGDERGPGHFACAVISRRHKAHRIGVGRAANPTPSQVRLARVRRQGAHRDCDHRLDGR